MLELLREGVALTKNNAKEHAQEFVNKVIEGHASSLESLVVLEYLSQVLDDAKAQIRAIATDELSVYGEEAKAGVSIKGVLLQVKEVGTRYDFGNTSNWVELKAQEDAIAERRKELEAVLKTLTRSMTNVNEETGEITSMFPPVKTSKTSVVISIPK